MVVHKLVQGGGYLRSRCGSLSGMLRGEPHRGGAGNGVRTWVWRVGRRLPAMLAGGALGMAGWVACNSAEADPEPEPAAPTVPESTETDAAELDEASADDDLPGPQDYKHPEPGEDIDDDGQAGAEAAAVYFVELYFYSYATGEFEAWDELSTEECGFCEVVRSDIVEIYTDGGYAVVEPPEIRGVAAQLDPARSGAYVVEVEFLDTAKQTFDRAG